MQSTLQSVTEMFSIGEYRLEFRQETPRRDTRFHPPQVDMRLVSGCCLVQSYI